MKRYRLSCWKFFQNTKSLQWLSPQSSRGVNSHVPFPQEINATEGQNYSTKDTFILHDVVLETFATCYRFFWSFSRFVIRKKDLKMKKNWKKCVKLVITCCQFPLEAMHQFSIENFADTWCLHWLKQNEVEMNGISQDTLPLTKALRCSLIKRLGESSCWMF